MAVTTTKTNKPLNPRGNDASPKGYNRAELFSGKALDFDGVNDVMNLGKPSVLNINNGAITLACYARIDATTGNHHLFRQENNNAKRILFAYQHSSTSITLGTYANGNYGELDATLTDSQRVQLLNEIVFIVATHDTNGDRKVYFNGQLIGSDNRTSGLVATNDQNAYIGANQSSEWWNGLIANFKIFNTALTAAQVADLYNNPEKIVPTGVADSALKLWLPMQEGAGTTAYDGSGNGNHGAVSGASWLHGIGAPVSQTAVIDWNKGTNLFPYSEDLSDSQWNKSATRILYAVDQTTAPDGQNTADEIIEAATGGDHLVFGQYNTSTYTDYTASIYMKDNTRGFGFVQIAPNAASSAQRYTVVVDLSNGSVTDTAGNSTDSSYDVTDAGNGWYRISVTRPHTSGSSVFIVYGLSNSGTPTYDSQFEPSYSGDGTSSLYVWGASLTASSSVTPYVPTFATAQTSPVLLPQGLTTGRDITGVNLFENVRKQAALNLDGNSWAEVHDNASLDITDAITLEAWVYWDGLANDDGIIGRWGQLAADKNYMLYAMNSGTLRFYINSSSVSVGISNGWNHVVGTYDKTNMKIYVNSSLGNSLSNTADITTSDKTIEIGRYYHGYDAGQRLYPNNIAQPRIYNRALTAEEVERNYNAGKNIYS